MVSRLLDHVDGYLVLDLHNLWCQAVNFELPLHTLLQLYPLRRVRVAHVAGGTWSDVANGGRMRRDTHDGPLPDPVLHALDAVRARCPALQAVIVERLGSSLPTPQARQELGRDLQRVREHLA